MSDLEWAALYEAAQKEILTRMKTWLRLSLGPAKDVCADLVAPYLTASLSQDLTDAIVYYVALDLHGRPAMKCEPTREEGLAPGRFLAHPLDDPVLSVFPEEAVTARPRRQQNFRFIFRRARP